MTYLIEQANVLKENRVAKCSIVVKDTNIDYISNSNKHLNFMRMDLSTYLLTPGHIMMNFSFSKNLQFNEFKEVMIKNYINKGCTGLVVVCDVKNERELSKRIEATKHFLLNSPIDFYICVKIPLKALTPSLVRACKKLKLPALVVDIENELDLYKIPWGWIKEAFYPYFFPLIPKWHTKEKSLFNSNKHYEIWSRLMEDHGIPTVKTCPDEKSPLSLDTLKKMGIYPAKGDIRIRGQLDYNLYNMDEMTSVNEEPVFNFDHHSPVVTMHKGKFLKIGAEVFFYPGFGRDCKVKLPGHFASGR
ncbi:hypothetical protein [Litchfieldia salsa]|uniref:Uncharacterized protein n=1 Tax=Litchfieldia salsa TaxID=930152 RepID=A0A1H0TMU2_9BACI|nr:hypothetical protein [Litchfieldia salsa]SDP54866.1 hypothetical protein SAMN05216565_103605 [Litchfieldia salsa]